MSEPLRTEPADPGPLSEAERAARIEQLLLSGLDHYFGGKYEQAINVWTRVAFLERGHGRARAYIERARSALAERQRESEESLHKGIAAYQGGDLRTARDLLTRAVEQGGAHETALVFLQRLARLDAAGTPPAAPLPRRSLSPKGLSAAPAGRRNAWGSTLVASVLVVAVIGLVALRTASWLREVPVPARASDAAPREGLPIVRGAERHVSKAVALHASGRSLEALRELDAVGIGDPLRQDADRLRADIQRALLSAVAVAGVPSAGESEP